MTTNKKRTNSTLRLLILEDSPYDAELEIAMLEKAGYQCEWERVESRADFLALLDPPEYDVILADYNLPAFDGLTALKLFLERDLDLPFILVSGKLGEEIAIESLKAGATDYVMKTRLSRLGPVVKRALREKEEQQQRKRAEKALRESEAKYKAILEAQPDLMFQLSEDGVHLDFYASTSDKLYLDPKEFLGKCVDEVLPPEVGEKYMHYIRETLKTSQMQVFEYQLDFPESPRYYDCRMVLSGENKTLAIVREITERKRAEEQLKQALAEKTTLLQELYHRTKNNMQVIHAMLALRASYVQDEQLLAVLEDVQDKIHAMALVHQKLYESRNLSSIDLQEYINDLAAYLVQSYQVQPNKISLELETDHVFVLIDTAVPCGLILSELISNTLKHAFPGDRAGRIKIQLHRAEDETITLEISDNGVGVPDDFEVRKHNSLGLQTVLGIVEHQLRGEIALETEHGVVWQIRFRDNLYRPRV